MNANHNNVFTIILSGMVLTLVSCQREVSTVGWKEIVIPEISTTFRIPGNPERKVVSARPSDGPFRDVYTYSSEENGVLLSVVYSKVDKRESNTLTIDQLLDSSRDGAMLNGGAKLISETKISKYGHPGREIFATVALGYIRMRIYMVGDTKVILLTYQRSAEQSDLQLKFLDSLEFK